MKLKLSPLWLFLLLLIVLIISSIFMKPSTAKESFIGFYGSTAANTTGLTIPNYPNPVNKLYDNDFFDPKNGNLLRVYAAVYNPTSGQDASGATIDHVDIVDRSGKSTTFQKGQPITTSTLTTIPNSYMAWTAYSTDPAFSKITSNQILYCAWGQDTYLHVLDLNNSLNACGYLYSGSGTTPVFTNFNSTLPLLGVAANDTNISNNTYIVDDIFTNMVVYQITSQIAYMPATGYLRIKEKGGNSVVYNRAGQNITNFKPTDTIQSATTPWTEVDLVGNNLVIYIPIQTRTIVAVLKKSSDGVSYSIVTVSRFNADGSLQKDANTLIQIPTNLKAGGSTTGGGDGSINSQKLNTDINILKSFFTSIGAGSGTSTIGAGDMGYTNQQISDYILKTQIVPPICPQSAPVICSGCGSGSCGGGCGSPTASAPAPTPSSTKTVLAAAPAPAPAPSGHSELYNDVKGAGKEVTGLIKSGVSGTADVLKTTGSEVGGLVKGGVSGSADILRETGSGAKSLLEQGASGTVNLGKSAVGGAVDLSKQAVGGAVDILKDVTKSSVNLAKEAGHETAEILRGEPYRVGGQGGRQGAGGYGGYGGGAAASTGYYGQQGAQGPQNPWTYNGALTEKPTSQFIPITADFSKFK